MKLIHGDCLVEMKNIPDKSIDLIVTDPPYKIITGGDSNGANSERPKGILKGNRELMPSIPKFDDWIPECFRILKDGSHAYFMVNSTNLLEMGECLKRAGFMIHNLLVWEKNNCTPSQFYMKNCEYIFNVGIYGICKQGRILHIKSGNFNDNQAFYSKSCGGRNKCA